MGLLKNKAYKFQVTEGVFNIIKAPFTHTLTMQLTGNYQLQYFCIKDFRRKSI